MARNLKLAKTRCLANREGAAHLRCTCCTKLLSSKQTDSLHHRLIFAPAPLLFFSRLLAHLFIRQTESIESGVKFHVVLRETDTRRTDQRTAEHNLQIQSPITQWPTPLPPPRASDRYATYVVKRCRDYDTKYSHVWPALSPKIIS